MTVTGYLRFPHVVGEQVVFVAEDDLWLASTEGGRASRLTADRVPVSRPRLSPDGSTVAWVSRRNGEAEVFAMPLDGGPARQLSYFGHPGTSVLGYDPAGRLIVYSAGSQPFRSHVWAYAIDLADGADATPQRLPYGPVTSVAHGPAGRLVVGNGYLRDYAHWKRYRGGTAGRLWLDPNGTGEFSELLAELVGPKTFPTWIGDRLAFLADFEGHGNVYSVAADGSELRRHTDHRRFYARQLAGDGQRLAYQHAGQLWLLDDLAADSQPRRLEVTLASPRAGRAELTVAPAEHLGPLSVDRSGRASAIEIRGSIVWLTHRNGPARVIASDPGVRYRLPAVLPAEDGADSVAYLSSADGPDAIEIAGPDGDRDRFGSGQLGRVLELIAAPDGSRLVVATHDGRLLQIGLDRTITELDRTAHGDISGLAFSPDSRWLAYAAEEPTHELTSIRLLELATGRVTAITERRFSDFAPAFSTDGRYLAFLSARTFDPIYDAHVFDLAFPLATRPYLVALAADTPSPFEPELAGQPSSDKPADGSGKDKAGKDNAGKDKAGKDNAGKDNADDDTDGTNQPIRVDLDGIADRIAAFPVAAGRLRNLRATEGGFSWTNAPIAGELGESRNADDDVRPALLRWDFSSRKLVELAEHVDAVQVSPDGRRLVIRDGKKLRVVPAGRKAAEDGSDTVAIDLERIRLRVQPPAEWAQMLDETARLILEHFWVEDMAGIDWPAEADKYLPLIDQLGSRDDLSDLLWEVNGETGSSHAYESPPPGPKDPLRQPAFLGADLAYRDGSWLVERVIRGDNSAQQGRSPLTAPGVGLGAGDRIVAVNGVAVGPAGPAELLRGTAGLPVELRVLPAGSHTERPVVVVPIASETELRYLDWVARRREIAHRASDGRIGYLHVPDMTSTGWAAFHRDLPVELDRDALILDTRDNSGGHTSQLIIEKLARRQVGWDLGRHRSPTRYPEGSPSGPLVSLANEWAGSDGDIVNAAFQEMGLGPVIGTRTWGGVIGIDGRYKLADGTSVTQPRYSFWFERHGWSVENYGIDPDQVVEFPPQAWAAGEDPQLAAGIEYLLGQLRERPARPYPQLDQRPSRRAPELPPRP